jgi:hypothetical protein
MPVISKEFEAELELSSNMKYLFRQLDEALEGSDIGHLIRDEVYRDTHFGVNGCVGETIEFYRFGGITIARERDERKGVQQVHKGGYPNCIWAEESYHRTNTSYYVIDGNRLVTDEPEARLLIQKATGIDLPRLDIPQEHHWFPNDPSKVVTSFDSYKEPESSKYLSIEDMQPGGVQIARELKAIVRYIDSHSLKGDPNLEGFYDIVLISDSEEVVQRARALPYSLYKEYERHLRPNERLRERRKKSAEIPIGFVSANPPELTDTSLGQKVSPKQLTEE